MLCKFLILFIASYSFSLSLGTPSKRWPEGSCPRAMSWSATPRSPSRRWTASPPSSTTRSSPSPGSEDKFYQSSSNIILTMFYKFYQESSRANTTGVVVKLDFAPYINKHYCTETLTKTFISQKFRIYKTKFYCSKFVI